MFSTCLEFGMVSLRSSHPPSEAPLRSSYATNNSPRNLWIRGSNVAGKTTYEVHPGCSFLNVPLLPLFALFNGEKTYWQYIYPPQDFTSGSSCTFGRPHHFKHPETRRQNHLPPWRSAPWQHCWRLHPPKCEWNSPVTQKSKVIKPQLPETMGCSGWVLPSWIRSESVCCSSKSGASETLRVLVGVYLRDLRFSKPGSFRVSCFNRRQNKSFKPMQGFNEACRSGPSDQFWWTSGDEKDSGAPRVMTRRCMSTYGSGRGIEMISARKPSVLR